jgi:hypothetical protein
MAFTDMLIGSQNEVRRVCRKGTAREEKKLCFFFAWSWQCDFEFMGDIELLDLLDRCVPGQGSTTGVHHLFAYLKYHFADIEALRTPDFT